MNQSNTQAAIVAPAAIATPIEITEDQWIEDYQPKPHPTGKENGYDYGKGSTLIDTSGPDRDYLDNQHLETIWSVIECDGVQVIAAGRHWVNCLGWIVTEKSWPHEMIEVTIDDISEDDDQRED